MRTVVIANPHSGAGRTGRRWNRLQQALERRLGPVEVHFTDRVGHAAELARNLLRGGCDRIIGVGGDGTFNEIANGFLENGRPVRPEACLGLVPAGTGGDLRRTLGIPGGAAAAIEALAGGVPRRIDVGRVAFQAHEGGRRERYFLNLTSFGMGGEVSALSRNAFTVLGGKAAFFWATLRVILVYAGREVCLTLDGKDAGTHRVLNVAVGNGLYHGGGMYVCPDAELDDGWLDITVIEELSLLTLLRDLRYLYNGRIYDHPKCRRFRARHIVAAASETTRIEVDGEPLGRLPVEIDVLPCAIRVIVPPGRVTARRG